MKPTKDSEVVESKADVEPELANFDVWPLPFGSKNRVGKNWERDPPKILEWNSNIVPILVETKNLNHGNLKVSLD